jgi:GntR family transcriptional repressor for pyruvate dehydrogenase complex
LPTGVVYWYYQSTSCDRTALHFSITQQYDVAVRIISGLDPQGQEMTVEQVSQNSIDILRPMTKDTLALRVCDAIKAHIVSENLAPGSQLPSERRLSETLAVSRNVVREGLSILVAEGMITKRPGKGIFLRDTGNLALAQQGGAILEQEQARYQAIREARAAVEVGAIGLIVSRITENDLEQLEQSVAELERKADLGEMFVSEDMQFHLILLRAARNDFLLQWSPMVEEVMRVWAYELDSLAKAIRPGSPRSDAARVATEHRAILAAIRERDVHKAQTLLKQHFWCPNSSPPLIKAGTANVAARLSIKSSEHSDRGKERHTQNN